MEEGKHIYEMVEYPPYEMVEPKFSNATATVTPIKKKFSLPAISKDTNQTYFKNRLITVLIGFNTLLALGGLAIGVSAGTKFSKSDFQTSALMANVTGKKILQIQASILALERKLYSLSQDVLNIPEGTNETFMDIMSIIGNFTGLSGKYSETDL